ncbi:hypothetical protein NTJ56_05920 [Burkholderia contaminans]|uniref:hypothetical protein n=1 Tax=Burkholderia contaminans TaxID=488447 RepID=UPI001CF1103E|nr:hypothetical protein [Burkholderia contaminans]MCA7918999.1 hypothetical protein [Burkholderia contaminans]UUX38347.1 hypothetical protein NTJ56_05920 [Burkholderia contaminans]
MCDSNVGVAKRIDVESISEDIADLIKQLDKDVEAEINVKNIKEIQEKLKKLIE